LGEFPATAGKRDNVPKNYFAVDFDCWLAWGVMQLVKIAQTGGLQTPKNSTPFFQLSTVSSMFLCFFLFLEVITF
jgi:hypothetical protein